MKTGYALLVLLLWPVALTAQTTVRADRFALNTGPCVLRSGSGSPEGVVTGNVCDTYWRTDTGRIYSKISGTGNTGWTSSSFDPLNINSHLLPSLTDTYDLGSWNKLWRQGYISQLNAVVFALETQTLFGGYSTIGRDAGALAADVSSVATTINFGKTMTAGHFVVIRGADTAGVNTVEYLSVGSLVSGTTYNVTRNLSGLGAKNWAAGMPFLVRANGSGEINLLAYDGKPKISFQTQGATYNAQTEYLRIGDLEGFLSIPAGKLGFAIGDSSQYLKYYDGVLTIAGNGSGITSINGGNITTGTVSANKLVVGPTPSMALNEDPAFKDTTAWSLFGAVFSGATDSAVGNVIAYNSVAGVVGEIHTPTARMFSIDPSKTYRVRIWARNNPSVPADGSLLVGISAFDASGNILNGGAGYFGISQTINTTWTSYVGTIPAFNAATRFAKIDVLFNNGGTVGYQEVQDPRIEEQLPSTLIQDGAITTDKITANAVTAAKIAANTITAGQIAAGTITGVQIDADAITSAKIAVGTIVASDIAAGTITATEIAANTITAAKIAAGTITATEIASGTITADRMNVSSLSAIAANLGTVTAGTVSGVTISGSTINAGSGNEVTLNSSGISISAGTGTNNKIKWATGAEMWGTSGGNGIYTSGSLSVEGPLLSCSGTNCGIEGDSLQVNGTGPISFVNMPSSTGTAVIWETSCGCLKKDSSSLRYKRDVRAWAPADSLAILDAPLIRFDFIGGQRNVVGLSAEELARISSDLVNVDAQGRPDSVRQSAFNASLIAAARELQREIHDLQQEIRALKRAQGRQ